MNAQEKAEEMKARLETVQREQQAIALAAIEAVEKGADPELAVKLAEAAANEIPSVSHYRNIDTNRLGSQAPQAPQPVETVAPFTEGIRIVRRDRQGGVYRLTYEDARVAVAFDENGFGVAPEGVAILLCRSGQCRIAPDQA